MIFCTRKPASFTLTSILGALALGGLACGGGSSQPGADAGPGDAGADAQTDVPPLPPRGPVRREPDPATMVSIPAGTFTMGSEFDKQPADYWYPWNENENPAHPVTLSAFAIDRDEVTVADYAAFLDAVGEESHAHPLQPMVVEGEGRAAHFTPAAGYEKMPMNFVTWYDAATFCAWTGKRLPTEAEWERAARGPANTVRPWGAAGFDCTRANAMTTEQGCERGPVAVGTHPKGNTPEGVRDLVGNVAEWVADRYGRYQPEAATDPDGPAEGPYRILRGGGFHDAPKELSGLARWGADPSRRSEGVGFRCAL